MNSKTKWKSTAQGVALLRAAAAQERDSSVCNPDNLAIRLLPAKIRIPLRIPLVHWAVVKIANRTIPGGYYFHTARTKCIDAIVSETAAQGLPQLVIMGAGLDTRAVRLKEVLTHTRVFEMDYPTTQQVKLERLSRAGIAVPPNTCYLPIDFNTQGLSVLFDKGFSLEMKTLWIWEGVCMYLEPGAVDRVLAFVRGHSGSGSSIVFDYIYQSMVEGKCDYYGARQSSRLAAKAREPYLFGIDEGGIHAFLEARGFKALRLFTPDKLEGDYLSDNGKVHGKVYRYTDIVQAAC